VDRYGRQDVARAVAGDEAAGFDLGPIGYTRRGARKDELAYDLRRGDGEGAARGAGRRRAERD
jgi:hypothetical protein